MTAYRLTAKQRAFVDATLAGMAPSAAYRAAGYKCDVMSPKAISVAGQKVKNNPSVRLALQSGETEARQAAVYDKTTAINFALEDRALARELGQTSAAVSANKLAADLSGLIVDRKDVTVRRLAEYSEEELRAEIAAAEAEMAGDTIGETKGNA